MMGGTAGSSPFKARDWMLALEPEVDSPLLANLRESDMHMGKADDMTPGRRSRVQLQTCACQQPE